MRMDERHLALRPYQLSSLCPLLGSVACCSVNGILKAFQPVAYHLTVAVAPSGQGRWATNLKASCRPEISESDECDQSPGNWEVE